MKNGYKTVFIVVVLLALCMPLTYIFGMKDKTTVFGAEETTELPSLQEQSFRKKKFQSLFEAWWTSHFALRKKMLKTKNQIYDWANLCVIHKGYSERIIEGKHRYLFGKYLLFSSVSQNYPLIPSFEKLAKLQKFAKNHNIDIYFVLAPNKALTYYDYLPARYRYFLRKCSVYNRLEAAISQLGIPAYNAQTLAEKLRSDGEIEPFPIGGIHWNMYGAGMAVKESAKYFKWGEVDLTDIKKSEHPYLTEQDLTNLQNLFFKKQNDKFYYNPILKSNFRWKDKTVIIGDSYSNEYTYSLICSGMSENGMVIHYENRPLIDTDKDNVLSAKRIIFVYTDDIINPTHQFHKKLDVIINWIEKK